MAYIQGQKNTIYFGSDFGGHPPDVWPTTGTLVGENLGFASVNEGSIANTVDESGGVWAVTTDTGDNDNAVFFSGTYRPLDGRMTLECRIKTDAITTSAMFVGFSETLALDTPVMPGEYDTTTLTYNGTGGMVGLLWDPDGTANDWRTVFGNGGAIVSGATTGGVVSSSVVGGRDAVNDVYDIVRVELGNDGTGTVLHNGVVIEEVTAAVTPGDMFHAVVMIENRDGSANVFEVDYITGFAGRNWEDGS